MRRLLAAALAACITFTRSALAAHAGYTVGAIRWDPAFYEPLATNTERANVEMTLGPAAYQSRIPTCGSVVNSYTVTFQGCSTQAQIDAEIAQAKAANIDYFVFCWFAPNSPQATAWGYYQTSTHSADVKWAVTTSIQFFNSAVSGSASYWNGYLSQSNYQTVTIGGTARPIIYLQDDGSATSALTSSITAMRSAFSSASLPNPYVVIMNGAPSFAASEMTTVGADAVGAYNFNPSVSASTYPSLVTAVEAFWTTMSGTGKPTIPIAMTGWDRRPRIEHPVLWEVATQIPWVGWLNYYAAGTPAQIAAHIGDMLTWMANNTAADPAKTGIIYSWNEHDEGGSALAPEIGTGSTILNAVAGAL